MTDHIVPTSEKILPGVTLCVCPTDKFKVGRFSLSLLLPLDDEATPVRTLLFSVLRRGNVTYPTLADINRRLDELYATPYHVSNTTRGAYQRIGFSAELLGEDYLPDGTDLLGGLIDLMKDMLFYPLTEQDGLLRARYIEAEKKNTVDHIRSIRNHPSAYAMTRFYDVFYRNEVWGHLLTGDEAQLRAITAEQLHEEWTHMLRHAPIRCFYVGDMPACEVARRVRAMLKCELDRIGRSFAPTAPLALCPSRMISQDGSVTRVEEELQAGQSHLILGFRTDVTLASPDFYAMMLCHEILGLSPVSRLFVHVREKHGLCYSCASEYHIDQGDIVIRCGLSEDNRALAESAILEQIRVMQAGEFTDAEWTAARKSLMNSYRQVGDSTGAIANFYDLRAILGVDQTVESCMAHFEAVTREQVADVAKRIRLDVIYFGRGTGEFDGEDGEDDV